VDGRQRRLSVAHARLIADLTAVLHRHDPVGIAEAGPDEYSPEAGTIAPRLPGTTSVDDVQRVVHEEFVHWFDEGTAGPAGHYRAVAEDVWSLVNTDR
jgi:hypothetical protein